MKPFQLKFILKFANKNEKYFVFLNKYFEFFIDNAIF